MYISDYEFYQYVTAADYLKELKRAHHIEIQRLYDDIHPTKIAYDSELGRIFSESINVEDYALWLIETKEKQKKQQSYYKRQAELFSNALNTLTCDQRIIFDAIMQRGEITFSTHPVVKKLKSFLEKQVVIEEKSAPVKTEQEASEEYPRHRQTEKIRIFEPGIRTTATC